MINSVATAAGASGPAPFGPRDPRFRGVIPIAPTPFLPDGAIDWASLDRLLTFYMELGVEGVTVLGLMGEAPKLEAAESLAILRHAVAVFGSKPVIMGLSVPGFAAMRALAREAMAAGAAAVMLAPIHTLKTDDQITGFYADAVAAMGTDVPFIVQDYPLLTGITMSVEVISRILNDHPSCVMLKAEDWPGLEKLSALRAAQATGRVRNVAIMTANGGLFLDCEMARGADGSNTGYAFPEMLQEVVRRVQVGARDAAQDLFDAHLPLLRYEQQPVLGLAVRKYVLMRRGLLAHDALRKPGATLGQTARAEVDYLLGRLARSDSRALLSSDA